MAPKWHVTTSLFKNNPMLEFRLKADDHPPFSFGKFKARKLLVAMEADPRRFRKLLEAFVAKKGWKHLVKNKDNPKWHVDYADAFRKPYLKFYLNERDKKYFGFGWYKAKKLLAAVEVDPVRFHDLISIFVEGGDVRGLIATHGHGKTGSLGPQADYLQIRKMVKEFLGQSVRPMHFAVITYHINEKNTGPKYKKGYF